MKNSRHKRILELIGEHHIETQEELAKLLQQEGFSVTQATVSRDIRELRLTKLSDMYGKQYYALRSVEEGRFNAKYIRVLKDGYISGQAAQNLLVIKTVAGMAMAVAAAIDALGLENVLGCIAGDDTIFCAVRDEVSAKLVLEKMKNLVS